MGVAYPSAIFAAPDGSGYTYSITAKISWDSSYYVTVESVWSDELSDSQFSWRIKGRASQGDSNTYAEEYVNDSFQGEANKEYVLQGCCVPGGTFDNSGSNYLFKLTSDSSGDDDDSGGGGSGGGSSNSCGVIHISKGVGVKTLNVTRTNSEYGAVGTIYDGSSIWVNDYFDIDVEAETGYELDTHTLTDSLSTYELPFYGTNLGIISARPGQAVSAYVASASDVTIRATTNGNSGDDDSGDSGSSSSNSSIYPESGAQNGVTATFTISGSTVTVKVSSTNLYWRINGTNSGGDHGTYYIGENRNSSGSFTAEDGHAYAFQVCSSSGTWSNGLIFYVNIDFSGGSSGGDDSGGSSSGGTNDGLKTYTVTALGVTAEVTYTSGPEVTITIKSWSGYSSIPYWRVKGVYSEGDANTYLEQNNKSSNSFDAYGGYDDGGKNYIFQVCKNGSWNNDGGNASKFHVDFSLSGDGSGGDVADSYIIHFNEGEGTNLTVTRTSSAYGATGTMYANGDIYYDDIWANDRFEIVVEAQEGYQLNELIVDGLDYANGVYTFNGNGDASITTSATLIASIRIFNKITSSWDTYTPYIYDGSSWNRYRPYIYDSSSWNMYS